MARLQYEKRRPANYVGPYSRRLKRGAIADNFDGRSTEGRYIRDLEKQLTEHVGGNPSITKRLLIQRIIELRLRLDAFDYKLANENKWTALDDRTYSGLQNAFRLSLRELGFKPAPPPQPTFAELVRRTMIDKEAAE